MKKVLIPIISLCLFGALSACVAEKMELPEKTSGELTFEASLEDMPFTKTSLAPGNDTRPVNWIAGDQACIGGITSAAIPVEGDATRAIFMASGALRENGVYKAWYPASVYNGGTPALPATQNWVDGRIDNLPMYAQSSNLKLPFKNLCSVLSLQFTGPETVTIGSVVLKTETSGQYLSGPFTVNWNDGNPQITMTGGAGSSQQVTLNLGSGIQMTPGTPVELLIALPPAAYAKNKLVFSVYDTDGNEIERYSSQKALTSSRNKYYPIEKDQIGDWDEQSMRLVIKTLSSGTTNATRFKLPFTSSHSPSFSTPVPANTVLTIDWGDGTVKTYWGGDLNASYDLTHTYADNDTEYTITITSKARTADAARIPDFRLNYVASLTNSQLLLREVLDPILKEVDSDFNNVFKGASNLVSVPSDVFSKNPGATSFKGAFQGCSSLTSIPENLFATNTEVTSFESAFEDCSKLTTIPDDLFATNREVTSFYRTFYGCSGLTCSLKSNWFKTNTKVQSFYYTFANCTNLQGSIPVDFFSYDGYAGAESITDIQGVFINCMNLTGAIPEDLFKYLPNLQNFKEIFNGCEKLTLASTTSSKLFCSHANHKNIKDFSNVFRSCKALTTIPSDIFAENTGAENFLAVFAETGDGIVVPANLFANNINATCFSYLFFGSKIQEIPGGLFARNKKVTNFSNTFQNAYDLKFLGDPFIDGTYTNKTNRFAEVSSVDFTRCFNWTSKNKGFGNAGAAPDLWNYAGNANFTKTHCFETRKDQTGNTFDEKYINVFTNYIDIKAHPDWLTLAP